jgi:hypothetical protein
MEVFGLLFVIVALVLIGVGIGLGLLACAIAAGLVAVGILSSSIIVGFLRHRPTAGLRAFLFQCGVVAGVPTGVVCAWIAHYVFSAAAPALLISFYGALGGAVAGLVIAFVATFALRQLAQWASRKAMNIAGAKRATLPA